MFKNKKAQGIPMETVIIAIIVLVVLVVIIAFFVGGSSTVVQKIKQLFGGSTAGTDRTQAIQFCQQYCDQLINANAQKGNYLTDPFCNKNFYIDTSGSGTPDRGNRNDPTYPYVKWYCSDTSRDNFKAKDTNTKQEYQSLGVSCNVPCQ